MSKIQDAFKGEIQYELYRIAIQVRDCHWISTPRGDQGHEWCPSCGRAKVRNMRRRDRRHRRDYHLDGGWRTDHDSFPVCRGCGAFLNGYLTKCGAREEIEGFRERGISTRAEIDALILNEIIDGLPNDETDDDVRLALKIANEILREHANANQALLPESAP